MSTMIWLQHSWKVVVAMLLRLHPVCLYKTSGVYVNQRKAKLKETDRTGETQAPWEVLGRGLLLVLRRPH